MIYIDNDTTYSQRIFIPKDEADSTSGVTGHTVAYQSKDYVITENGTTRIHPDAGYDAITGGSIGVYVTAATGITPEHLEVTEDGLYVPTGDTVYTGVTVQVYDSAYQDGYGDGYDSGYTSGNTDGYASGSTDGYNEGYASGYTSGNTDGYASGTTDGYTAGYASGYTDGYTSGRTDGYQDGYDNGVNSGRADGYSSGVTDGYASGFTDGSQSGYAEGYTSGYTDGFVAGYASGRTDGYQEGYDAGVAYQKSLLSAVTITENGVTTYQNGVSAVTVDLPIVSMSSQIKTNGVYHYTATDPYAGFDDITIDVSIPGAEDIMNWDPTATTNNKLYLATDYEGGTKSGFRGIYVAVPPEGLELRSETFSANSTYTPTGFGGWSAVTVNVPPRDAVLSSDTITQNGHYTPSGFDGWSGITVDVAQTGTTSTFSSETFTANGSYTPSGFDGWSAVTVNLDTATTYNNGYYDGRQRGFDEGRNAQKALLSAETFTTNGTYQRSNGLNEVTVDVDTATTYQSGYTAGVAWRDAQDIRGVFTENKTYTRSNTYGWNEVVVRVDTAATYNEGYTSGYTSGSTDGYNSGYTSGRTSGINYQKSLLTSTTITSNGTYTRANGWSGVTVNVASTSVVTMTMAQYQAAIKNNNTIYLIKG